MTSPNTKGKDYNYFARLPISSSSFSTNSDVTFAFSGNPSFSLINEGSGVIEYSFNGSSVAGDLVPGTPSAAMAFNHRGYSSVWFKLKSGSASNLRIEATANGEITFGPNPSPLGVQSSSNSISTLSALSTSFATGQLAVTAVAQALGSATSYKNGVVLTNMSSSSTSVFVGPSGVTTTTGFELQVGSSIILPIQDISTIYAIASAVGSRVSYLGLV